MSYTFMKKFIRDDIEHAVMFEIPDNRDDQVRTRVEVLGLAKIIITDYSNIDGRYEEYTVGMFRRDPDRPQFLRDAGLIYSVQANPGEFNVFTGPDAKEKVQNYVEVLLSRI